MSAIKSTPNIVIEMTFDSIGYQVDLYVNGFFVSGESRDFAGSPSASEVNKVVQDLLFTEWLPQLRKEIDNGIFAAKNKRG